MPRPLPVPTSQGGRVTHTLGFGLRAQNQRGDPNWHVLPGAGVVEYVNMRWQTELPAIVAHMGVREELSYVGRAERFYGMMLDTTMVGTAFMESSHQFHISPLSRVQELGLACELLFGSESVGLAPRERAVGATAHQPSPSPAIPRHPPPSRGIPLADSARSRLSGVADRVVHMFDIYPASGPADEESSASAEPSAGSQMKPVRESSVGSMADPAGESSVGSMADPAAESSLGSPWEPSSAFAIELVDQIVGPGIVPLSTATVIERVFVDELKSLWISSRPAWVDPDWYDLPLSKQARKLLTLEVGPELLAALVELTPGVCSHDHSNETPSASPPRGVSAGLPCECQLVGVAGWEALGSWYQGASVRYLLGVMGSEIVQAPQGLPVSGRRTVMADPAREEVAIVLRSSPSTVVNRLGVGRSLAPHAELVATSMRGGCAFWVVKAIVRDLSIFSLDAAQSVTRTVAARVDERLRTDKSPWTSAQIRAMARRLIMRLNRDTDDAPEDAAKGRYVYVHDGENGMAMLEACLPSVAAHRIFQKLSKAAKDLDDPDRTMDQTRADVFADVLLTPFRCVPANSTGPGPSPSAEGSSVAGGDATPPAVPDAGATPPAVPDPRAAAAGGLPCSATGWAAQPGSVGGPRVAGGVTVPQPCPNCRSYASTPADIQVIVRLETLLGLDSSTAEVPGLGPIPAEVARELAADGRWRAWITDSTGTVTSTGSRRYKPSVGLARLVRAREPDCRMPGCRRPSVGCDLDHTVPWPGGRTEVTNLGPLCRRHHNLKTHGGWQLRNVAPDTTAVHPRDMTKEGGGGFGSPSWEWTTPTGKRHRVEGSPPLADHGSPSLAAADGSLQRTGPEADPWTNPDIGADTPF